MLWMIIRFYVWVKWEPGELEKADFAVTCLGDGGSCQGWGKEG